MLFGLCVVWHRSVKRKKKEKRKKKYNLRQGISALGDCGCPLQDENEEKRVFCRKMMRESVLFERRWRWFSRGEKNEEVEEEAVILGRVCPQEGVLVLLCCFFSPSLNV